MNRPALHFALRETTALLRNPRVWVGIAAVAVILGLSGPFGTTEFMRLVPRLGYWSLIAVVTFFSGAFISELALAAMRPRDPGFVASVVVAGLATGLVVAVEVLALNWLALGVAPTDTGYFLGMFINCLVIAMIISAALAWTLREAEDAKPKETRLLDRLDFDKRGPLISLTQQDHYVEVATDKGTSLILMRLGDAIAETEGTPGMQIHRSHWVARQAVVAARKASGKGIVTLVDGRELPISRTYLRAATAAGLFAGAPGDG